MIEENVVHELLREKPDGYLFHREGQTVEFKEQFNLSGLADYFRDFAAFANNRGGHLIFGVKDAPRICSGMSAKATAQFEKVDPEKITGFLNEIFSSEIRWEQASFKIAGKTFGVFFVYESKAKPIIAKKDEGKDATIRNGDIYYRYGGRTQRILSPELEAIILGRIERTNRDWIEHVKSIGLEGPRNTLVLRAQDSISTTDGLPMVIDQKLLKEIEFIKEGEFKETKGAKTLKLIGDIAPIEAVEIEKVVQENLFNKFPYSAKEVAKRVKAISPKAKEHEVWKVISENKIKGNPDYSQFNFRNKEQEERYKSTGQISSVTPVIYNQAAVELISKLIEQLD